MSGRAVRGPLSYSTHKIVLSGDYTVVNESIVIVNKTSGAATQITLPPAASAGGRREVIVVDGKGDAATYNITVVPAGSNTINGGSSHVISEKYGGMRYVDNGSGNWIQALPPGVSSTEIGFLNGVTAGTAAASKADVRDSGGDITIAD